MQNNISPLNEPLQIKQQLVSALELQRKDFLKAETESAQVRINHLNSLKSLLRENKDQLIQAINTDYGNRSYHETLIADYISSLGDIDHSIKHLKSWMKPQRRSVDLMLYFGAKNRVIPQPIGVVGVIVPWNFPINMVFTQLSAIFSAGNRAIVKMSENSIELSKLLQKLCADYFPPEKLQFFIETGGVGIEFSKLPFDHLMFTGSGATGRKVMAAAAENLTPVTLELGGKCPAIIDPDFPLQKAVERILFVKQFNAGQICTTVDYVYVHQSQLSDFVEKAKAWAKKHIPDITSKDYTSIIDDRAYERLMATLKDAKDKGAEIIELCNQGTIAESRKVPLTLVLNTSEDMQIRQRETFGPILMVKTYHNEQEVIEQVNDGDRPLAIYPFTNNKQLCAKYIDRIMSGGVTVNDALFHVGQSDMPFGGVGASGMGHYHGHEGFLTFSKLRPVMYQASMPTSKYLAPPYSKGIASKMFQLILKLKG